MIFLVSTTILSSTIFFVSGLSTPFSAKKQLSKETIVGEASMRLHQLADAISNVRDTVCTDSVFVQQLKSDASQALLFEIIHSLDSLRENRFTEILPLAGLEKYSFLKGRGIAYYDITKRLTAWNLTKSRNGKFRLTLFLCSFSRKTQQIYFRGIRANVFMDRCYPQDDLERRSTARLCNG